MVSEERDRLLWRKAQHTAFEKYLRDQSMTAFEQKKHCTAFSQPQADTLYRLWCHGNFVSPNVRPHPSVRDGQDVADGRRLPLPKETSRPDVRWVTETDAPS